MNVEEYFKDKDVIPLEVFCEFYKTTKAAVYSKISRGDWKENEQYFKAPDRTIHIYLPGYKKWVTKGYSFDQQILESGSSTKNVDTMSRYRGHRHQQIVNAHQSYVLR